ncbi:hypothetical protein HPB52_024290 [Rhipicephalus sanguineus]|uniref:Uncharacterized protein n=1 Tax=Rhipicephalus sanguineus TaxID=34632 RepID=A0A9D4YRC9_RHISA|nr:hypothetical protein HPB52_024290 [Rhipicephalus sanguineus]
MPKRARIKNNGEAAPPPRASPRVAKRQMLSEQSSDENHTMVRKCEKLVGGASLPSMRTARSATTRIIRTKLATRSTGIGGSTGRAMPVGSLRPFMAEQVLPFWARAWRSRKWRRLPKGDDLTPEFVGSFTCGDIHRMMTAR